MVTINEVAQAAGVSISTVSYALSGKRPVSVDTRRRIEQAVAQLGYSPNAGARMLAGRRTQIFALTEPLRVDTHAPTHMAFVLATAVAARRNDYDILLLTDEDAQAGMQRVAASGLVDAILVLDVAPDDARVALSREIEVPSIFIGIPDDHDGLVCVDLDFERAAEMAVDRLAEAGHRRIGLLGHPEVSYVRSNFPPRVRSGLERAARAADIGSTFRPAGVTRATAASVREATNELLAEGVSALVLHCAEEAHFRVLETLAEAGVRVPEDISVVSVGSSFDRSTLSTPLDSIPLVPAETCELAVELAVASLAGEAPAARVHLVAPHYIAAGSVAAATR